MEQEFRQLLKDHARVLDRMQYAPTVDRQPDADMHRVAGLAQQYSIALDRLRHGHPALSLGVVAEGSYHNAQIVGIHLDFRQVSSKVFALDGEEQAPAVIDLWSARTGVPRPTDVLHGPMRVGFPATKGRNAMSNYFHPNVLNLNEKTTAIDKNGMIRTELVVTVNIPMESNHPDYEEATCAELINRTVEFLKTHGHYDGAVFLSKFN